MTYTPTVWADGDCVMAADMNNIENGVDRAQGDVMVLRGLTAAIPASDPLLIGRLYFESDLLFRVWRDNGAGWDQVHAVAAAGGAWTLIQEQILLAPAATVTFAAIPGTYRSLKLIGQIRGTRVANNDDLAWRANADAAANYHWMNFALWSNGDTGSENVAANQAQLGDFDCANAVANKFSPIEVLWPGYARADRHKHAISMMGMARTLGGGAQLVSMNYTGWQNVAAITSLTFLPIVGPNFATGSIFALYGIA